MKLHYNHFVTNRLFPPLFPQGREGQAQDKDRQRKEKIEKDKD